MTTFFTIIFLICTFIVLIPVALVGWDMYRANITANDITALMARTLLYITLANLVFHGSQFISVLLGFIGVGMAARIPVIILIDGSLILLMGTYIYAYFRIRAIRAKINM